MGTILILLGISLIISIPVGFMGKQGCTTNSSIVCSVLFAIFSVIITQRLFEEPLENSILRSIILLAIFMIYDTLSILVYHFLKSNLRKRLAFEQPLTFIFVTTVYSTLFI